MNKPLQFNADSSFNRKTDKNWKVTSFSFNCKYGLKGHLMKAFAAEILRLLLKH